MRIHAHDLSSFNFILSIKFSYGDQYTSIKPRVIKLLTQQALRIDRPFPTQYGGIVGISLFGSRAIDAFLLPLARAYWERWEMELDIVTKSGGGGGDALREYELHMCQQALLVRYLKDMEMLLCSLMLSKPGYDLLCKI